MLGMTSDWALKRVARFLLKRHLGRLLPGDLDLDSLDVALGAGSLELRSLLLDCDYLNAQLVQDFMSGARGSETGARAVSVL